MSWTGSARAGCAPRTRLAGWRFLIRSGDRAVAAADTMLTPDGWTFSHFFEGPYIAATERALRQAETLTPRYQPRLLSVPELYMLTLWLHGDTEADAAGGSLAAHRPPGAAGSRPARHRRTPPAPGRRAAARDDAADRPGPGPLLGSPA